MSRPQEEQMMPDYIIDTNVLIIASSLLKDSHVPIAHRKTVFNWLRNFEHSASDRVVFDQQGKVCKEYRQNLTDQDYGFHVIMKTKMDLSQFRYVNIDYNKDGMGLLP